MNLTSHLSWDLYNCRTGEIIPAGTKVTTGTAIKLKMHNLSKTTDLKVKAKYISTSKTGDRKGNGKLYLEAGGEAECLNFTADVRFGPENLFIKYRPSTSKEDVIRCKRLLEYCEPSHTPARSAILESMMNFMMHPDLDQAQVPEIEAGQKRKAPSTKATQSKRFKEDIPETVVVPENQAFFHERTRAPLPIGTGNSPNESPSLKLNDSNAMRQSPPERARIAESYEDEYLGNEPVEPFGEKAVLQQQVGVPPTGRGIVPIHLGLKVYDLIAHAEVPWGHAVEPGHEIVVKIFSPNKTPIKILCRVSRSDGRSIPTKGEKTGVINPNQEIQLCSFVPKEEDKTIILSYIANEMPVKPGILLFSTRLYVHVIQSNSQPNFNKMKLD